MATKKISQLTPLTTANNSIEFLINDGGTSKKITRADIFTGVSIIESVTSATLTLDAIAASIAGDAVDIFIYDTSKDSDGGAWRKRTQHTSWYNEPDLPAGTGAGQFNSLTRSTRKDFPAVAVIVAETNKVTIYDGDDPDMPMWMVFNIPTASIGSNWDLASVGIAKFSTSITSVVTGVAMNNGVLSLGSYSPVYGLYTVGFILDTSFVHGGGAYGFKFPVYGNLAQRNSTATVTVSARYGGNSDEVSGQGTISAGVNDVAMTVLPNAPVDSTTLLPIPTIAVATDGGTSIIKDDGTVVDITGVLAHTEAKDAFVLFDDQDRVWLGDRAYSSPDRALYLVGFDNIPTGDTTVASADFKYESIGSSYVGTKPPTLGLMENAKATSKGIATAGSSGLTQRIHNTTAPSKGSVAYITSDYNTGYMTGDIRGAWNVDTDVTALSGTEEVGNTLVANVTGWVATASNSITWNASGYADVFRGGGAYNSSYALSSPLVVGKTYIVSVNVVVNNGGGYAVVWFGGSGGYSSDTSIKSGTGVLSDTFVATVAHTHIWLYTLPSTTSSFKEISVREAVPDRSVKDNGLAVHGTPTVSAVATGAELKAISGFSSSNYLEQPYNSDLDFGTGDFSWMGWIKPTSHTNNGTIVSRANSYAMELRNDGTILMQPNDGVGGVTNEFTNSTLPNGVWTFVVASVANSGVDYKMYLNGVLDASQTGTARDVSEANTPTRLGLNSSSVRPLDGSLALWRISATAPSAEQIKEIYEAEKPLFQANAKCTLNGTSDAVTALAYDDDTELLHVGASGGRSTFQGLRRVDETSTSTTEIAASGGLVIEETA